MKYQILFMEGFSNIIVKVIYCSEKWLPEELLLSV